MSFADKLEEWRDPSNWESTPTDEQVMRQLLFGAIADFIEEHEEVLVDWLASSDDEIPGLDSWIDEYAERPLSEANGYQRLVTEPSSA